MGTDMDSDPIPVGLESESDFVQCENFCIVQCSHWVWSTNPSLNPSSNPAV